MTKAQLFKKVSDKTSCSKELVREVIETSVEILKESLKNGEDLYYRGFATIKTKNRKKNYGWDFNGKKTIEIPPYRDVILIPSKAFKREINTKKK